MYGEEQIGALFPVAQQRGQPTLELVGGHAAGRRLQRVGGRDGRQVRRGRRHSVIGTVTGGRVFWWEGGVRGGEVRTERRQVPVSWGGGGFGPSAA